MGHRYRSFVGRKAMHVRPLSNVSNKMMILNDKLKEAPSGTMSLLSNDNIKVNNMLGTLISDRFSVKPQVCNDDISKFQNVLMESLATMDSMTIEDLYFGVTQGEHAVLPAVEDLVKHNICIDIVCTKDYHIAVFVIPVDTSVGTPTLVHSHPDMVVLSKVLYGELSVIAYNGITNAKCVRNETRTDQDSSWLLSPKEGNFHQFSCKSGNGCVVLDVLLPPYEPSNSRPCKFYRVQEGASCQLMEVDAPIDILPTAYLHPSSTLLQ